MIDRSKYPPLLTVIEVAKLVRISRQSIYNMIRRGVIKSVHIGGCIRVPRDELIDMLEGKGGTP